MITEIEIVEILKKNTQNYFCDNGDAVLTLSPNNLKNLKLDLVKLLNLDIVTQQRELLKGFIPWEKENRVSNCYRTNEKIAKNYLKTLL
jgi:hypothetical protein